MPCHVISRIQHVDVSMSVFVLHSGHWSRHAMEGKYITISKMYTNGLVIYLLDYSTAIHLKT